MELIRLARLDQALADSIKLFESVIEQLENRDQEEAYRRLNLLLEIIPIFTAIFSADLGWIDEEITPTSGGECTPKLEAVLVDIASHRESGFWVAICDTLEYELIPILQNWRKLVATTISAR